MKYLRKFNETKEIDVEEVKQEIHDVLLPLNDIGANIRVDYTENYTPSGIYKPGENYIWVGIIGLQNNPYYKDSLKWLDIKDEIERLNDIIEKGPFEIISVTHMVDGNSPPNPFQDNSYDDFIEIMHLDLELFFLSIELKQTDSFSIFEELTSEEERSLLKTLTTDEKYKII